MVKKSIVTGALILTLAGIITRILGFVYRIYMSNVLGAEGMGLYQLILPVYALAWSISCAGFTTTISKLTAQEKAKGEMGNVKRFLKQAVVITAVMGTLVAVLLYFSAEFIAVTIFREPRIALSLRIIAFGVPFMAAGSCLRGYFFGLQQTIIPAVNQVLEQIVRMAVIFLIVDYFIPMGLEYASAAAAIGIMAEEIFSFAFIAVSYRLKKKRGLRDKLPSLPSGRALLMIVTMAAPLTANRVAGSLLSAFENALIPQRLQVYGLSAQESISLYGQITGMAMPLIYFPSAFLLSLSISLVPAVSEASAVGNARRIHYTASKSMLFASIIGFGAAAVFIVFASELGLVIYNQDIARMLILLGIMCPFLYMQVVLSGILNGLGYQMFIFRNSLISSAISIGFIFFLTPHRGVDAFILGWFASLIVVCFLEIKKLRQSVDLQFEFANWFVKPLLSGLGAGLVVRLLAGRYVFAAFGDIGGLVIGIGLLGMLYMLLILLLGCLSVSDLRVLFRKGAE